jgi:ER membrane protein complex subunit 6
MHAKYFLQTISQIRSLSSLFLGVAAGILGLESQWGFLFYFITQFFISGLIYFVLAHGRPGEYFAGSGAVDENVKGAIGQQRLGALRDVWLGSSLFEGLSGFVLGWAGVGGVVR